MRSMTGLHAILIAGALAAGSGTVCALGLRSGQWARLDYLNGQLQGSVLDYTHNHGMDRRIYSPVLGERRDLYVYLPPGYDPQRAYPAMIFLHGIAQDEQFFLQLAPEFDTAMVCGQLPPFIIVAPDGSIRGQPTILKGASFYLNTNAGRFEDWIVCDVWNFLRTNFPIRPEREAHILCGSSAGGFGAYNIGFKHRDEFRILAGFLPALNLRYQNCHGRYFAPFDPSCTGLRERLRPWQPVARYFGIIAIREKQLSWPLFGKDRDAIRRLAAENPVEMLDRYDIQPGEFDMFVAYGGRDEFNIHSQVESFLHVAHRRGLPVEVAYDPNGHHVPSTVLRLFPDFVRWLGPLLRSYEPATMAPEAAPNASAAASGGAGKPRVVPRIDDQSSCKLPSGA
jgi:S-formylglutathione hydrolase FrmB